MKTITRVKALGGSLIAVIPKELVREEGLSEGELVEIEVEKTKKDFFGALRGIGSFAQEDELKSELN